MLLVRFSFCEYGSIVCGSPRPAQRRVFASTRGTAASAAANAAATSAAARAGRRNADIGTSGRAGKAAGTPAAHGGRIIADRIRAR